MLNLFQPDSKVIKFLTTAFSIMVLNTLVIVMCIPIVTAGAAIVALYSVCLKLVRDEDPSILKDYFKAFRDGFWQTTLFWGIILIVGALFIWNAYLVAIDFFKFNFLGKLTLGVMFALFLCFSLWIFILQSRYRNSVKRTIQNAMYLTIRYLPKNITMLIIGILPVFAVMTTSWWMIMPILGGVALAGYIKAVIYSPLLKVIEDSRLDCM